MTARVVKVEPFDLVVFGATGDLGRRKLLPALYHRDAAGQLPDDARIIGSARGGLTVQAFRDLAAAAIAEHVAEADRAPALLRRFLARLDYVQIDATSEKGWPRLVQKLSGREDRIRAYYLAVGPDMFAPIARRLKEAGLAGDEARLIVEKPVGHDRASAKALNKALAKVFPEANIYRIDHYLGKETVQNLMALRFANALFEPVWNSRHVDHVQITVAETVGVEGRGDYYDRAGAMRDMVQNHLLQLLCLTAMEPPSRFEPDAVRDEKLKVLRALEPIDARNVDADAVRGQYAGHHGLAGYAEDVGRASSTTESFVALKVGIGNWRWSGAPFYLRTGKRLRARMSEIVVVFKDVPHSIFAGPNDAVRQNVLAMRLQPDEGVTLTLTIKDPGPGGMRLRQAPLDMTFSSSLGIDRLRMPDAYERLVLDVIRGDQTLFMRRDEVEAAWAWVDPIITAWGEAGDRPNAYDAGSSGPAEALRLLHRDNRRWREIEA